jgi:RNA polymerase sigma-70 factor (ECF subfamily)
MDDSRIIELYWNRDESAISETETKYGAYCRSIALRMLEIMEDAEECVSDTWLSAWNSMPPQVPSRLELFLGRITRNSALDRLRSRSRQKRGGGAAVLALDELGESVPSGDSPQKALEDSEIAAVISRWLRTLSPEKRGVFVRRYWYFDTVEEIARRYGISTSKATSLLYRLRRQLKLLLESEGIVI